CGIKECTHSRSGALWRSASPSLFVPVMDPINDPFFPFGGSIYSSHPLFIKQNDEIGNFSLDNGHKL
ncbi:MAG: hypothetical protein IJM93_01580, partial [Oscillospiraceae bacterium]|nr:hypothetical protein [Oscillospiraceae bacterium]